MTNSTTIYLVVANVNGLNFNVKAYYSQSKAYRDVAQLNIDKPDYSYTIEEIQLLGD